MKRKVHNSVFVLLVVFLVGMSFVSAAPGDSGPLNDLIDGTANVVEKVFRLLKPLTDAILGTDSIRLDGPDPQNWTEQIVIRLILISIVFALSFTAVTRMGIFGDRGSFITVLISIGVSILATRWFAYPGGFLEAVLLPYGAMGLTIASFLPLLIFFFFIEVGLSGIKNAIFRKGAWILFAVFFTFLWLSRYNALYDATSKSPYVLWVYPVTAVLCILFFIFDSVIQKWLTKYVYLNQVRDYHARKKIAQLYKELDELRVMEKNGETKIPGSNRLISTRKKHILDEIADISAGKF